MDFGVNQNRPRTIIFVTVKTPRTSSSVVGEVESVKLMLFASRFWKFPSSSMFGAKRVGGIVFVGYGIGLVVGGNVQSLNNMTLMPRSVTFLKLRLMLPKP
ncbi:hypothetical protein ACOME3_007925 [Neoechinorhynchus agilis]